MYLILDTETTGKPVDFRAPFTDLSNWPRAVQIAWVEFDARGNRIGAQDLLIKPVGFKIPAEATRIHGITTEKAKAQGVSLKRALSMFSKAAANAQVIVAHNVNFDVSIVRAELLRAGLPDCLDGKAFTCTMQESTQYRRPPGGRRGYKWPSLSELYHTLFRMELQETHNAAVDVEACARCFFELQRLGVMTS